MADEIVYRLLQGEGIQIVEDSAAKTVTVSVPALETKVNIGDIVQATESQIGLIELATVTEVRAGSDSQRAVTPAGLAAATLGSATDLTAGRLLKVGSFGIGDAHQLVSGANLNALLASGFYRLADNHVGLPIALNFGQLVVSHGGSSVLQIASDAQGAVLYFRNGFDTGGSTSAINTWSPWRSLWHAGNFDPATKANTSGVYSGLDVGNAGTVGGQTAAMLAPPGMVAHFVSTPPSGWLVANGSIVSRTTYASLFAAIGTTFGAGNGSTTFNLPDLRGLFIRGWDAGRGIDSGRTFASVQNSANLSHSHSGSSDTNSGHSHTIDGVGNHNHANGAFSLLLRADGTFTLQDGDNSVGEPNLIYSGAIQPAGAHTHSMQVAGAHGHTLNIDASGSAESRPINMALLACIKY